MVREVGDEYFDSVLSQRVGLIITNFSENHKRCESCAKVANPQYRLGKLTASLCLPCFRNLQSKMAAILVLQVTDGK